MNLSNTKSSVLGIPVSPRGVGNVEKFLREKESDKSQLVTFVNPLACYLVSKHPNYTDLLDAFDIVACDGIGMVLAARSSGLTAISRESFDFTSLAGDVLQWAADQALTVGLIGGVHGIVDQSSDILKEKYPGMSVVGCFSGYGADLGRAKKHFVEQQTDIVLCGMGAPLQERFLVELVEAGWKGSGFTCGGFLDQIITGEDYYPDWIDRFNIRFLYRLAKEPRRLWRRYLVHYQVFLSRYAKLQWRRAKAGLGLGQSTAE